MIAESDVRIRPIREDEYAAEAALVNAAYAAGPYAAELSGNAAWERTERDTQGRHACGCVLVAERAGQIVGAASVLRGGTAYAKLAAEGDAELRLVSVSPAAQGAGIGEALVRAGMELALRWGSGEVLLDTGVRNPAQRLYERLGFERTPEADGDLADSGYGDSLTYRYRLQGRDGVRVREMRNAETAAVSELVVGAYRDDYARLDASYLAVIADVASRANAHLVWVAEDIDTGELLGTVTTPRERELLTEVARPGEFDIRLLGTSQRARGRGIGELLTRHSLRLARIRGIERLMLETSPEMPGAIALYDRLGFDRVPERERVVVLDSGAELALLAYGTEVAKWADAHAAVRG